MGEVVQVGPEKQSAFVDEFLQEYLSRGFGSLSKREIDVLMMHLLMTYADLNSMGNFNLSLALKLSETKIKNLRYEANLKYLKDTSADEIIETAFVGLLMTAELKSDKQTTWIMLSIEDSYLKHAIQAKIKSRGSFTDSSFNSEIVKICTDDFAYLFDEVCKDEQEKDALANELAKLVKDQEKVDFKKLVNLFLESAAKSAGDEVGKRSIAVIADFFTGGMSQALPSIKAFRLSFKKES